MNILHYTVLFDWTQFGDTGACHVSRVGGVDVDERKVQVEK